LGVATWSSQPAQSCFDDGIDGLLDLVLTGEVVGEGSGGAAGNAAHRPRGGPVQRPPGHPVRRCDHLLLLLAVVLILMVAFSVAGFVLSSQPHLLLDLRNGIAGQLPAGLSSTIGDVLNAAAQADPVRGAARPGRRCRNRRIRYESRARRPSASAWEHRLLGAGSCWSASWADAPGAERRFGARLRRATAPGPCTCRGSRTGVASCGSFPCRAC